MLDAHDGQVAQYEKAVRQAFVLVREKFSSDRVLADPDLNAKFIVACRDFGVDDSIFRLNLALIGLRKHSKLKLQQSKRSIVPEQWRYAIASEIAARVMHFRYGTSVDTTLAHPTLVAEFDALAAKIVPGFSPFEYRWAALNVRKKGASAKIAKGVIGKLDWNGPINFGATTKMPEEAGVYSLFEGDTCLFVAGSEDIRQSVESQQTIAYPNLFDDLWRPKPQRLNWQCVTLPESTSDYRFGVVRTLVGERQPVFNIPRGKRAA
ncbi:MAG TPA: hypothetical protein VFE47_10795 [Tepidisphaeraceae bacterium]|nr:hypothetical protein [Tepidisphaeraceae bacterium]